MNMSRFGRGVLSSAFAFTAPISLLTNDSSKVKFVIKVASRFPATVRLRFVIEESDFRWAKLKPGNRFINTESAVTFSTSGPLLPSKNGSPPMTKLSGDV